MLSWKICNFDPKQIVSARRLSRVVSKTELPARGPKQPKIPTKYNYLFNNWWKTKILAHRYFFSMRDKGSHSESGVFYYFILLKNKAKKVVYIRELKQRIWGQGRQEGCARSGSSTAFMARKAKIKQWMVFGRTRVTNVWSEFCCLKRLHSSDSDSWHSILKVGKIFVAKGDSYIFFAPFSYEYFILHIYSLSLKCRRVQFDCVDQCVVSVV